MEMKFVSVHTCEKTRISLTNGDGACLSYGENEDEGINDIPNGFICKLLDGSTWAVENRQWTRMDNH